VYRNSKEHDAAGEQHVASLSISFLQNIANIFISPNLDKLSKHKFKNENLITAMWYIFEILETQLRKRLLP
jgi:hypothetical protein